MQAVCFGMLCSFDSKHSILDSDSARNAPESAPAFSGPARGYQPPKFCTCAITPQRPAPRSLGPGWPYPQFRVRRWRNFFYPSNPSHRTHTVLVPCLLRQSTPLLSTPFIHMFDCVDDPVDLACTRCMRVEVVSPGTRSLGGGPSELICPVQPPCKEMRPPAVEVLGKSGLEKHSSL